MEICSLVSQQGVPKPTKHKLFCTWRMMNYRCYSDVHTSFHRYGGRGIEVCEEWRWDNPYGLFNFLSCVGERPHKHTLDRIDPKGGYSPDNWRWADKRTQQNNFDEDVDTDSGRMGVVRHLKTRWRAQVTLHGKPYCAGIYKNLDEAVAARDEVQRVKVEFGDDAAVKYIEENKETTPEGKRFYGRKTSRFYGVSWHKTQEVWRAVVARRDDTGKLRQVYLGCFDIEEDANQAVLDFLEKEKKLANCV